MSNCILWYFTFYVATLLILLKETSKALHSAVLYYAALNAINACLSLSLIPQQAGLPGRSGLSAPPPVGLDPD